MGSNPRPGERSLHRTDQPNKAQSIDANGQLGRPSPRSPKPEVDPSPVHRQDRSEDRTVVERWKRTRYGLYAPIYDWLATPWEPGRKRAIDRLDLQADERICILGAGTGGDLEHLPPGVEVTAIDRSPAMIERTAERAEHLGLDVDARIGDAQSLSFDDDTFDAVLLHLVLSVVSDPTAVVNETARVLDPGGRVSIYDKFVPVGEKPSWPRRAINPVAKLLFADLNRSLEPMLTDTEFQLDHQEPFLGGIYSVTIARPHGSD